MELIISYRGTTRTVEVTKAMSLGELQARIEEETNIPPENQKLISKIGGLMRPDKLPNGGNTLLSEIFPGTTGNSVHRIMLMGTPKDKLDKLAEAEVTRAEQEAMYQRRLRNMRKHGKMPARTSGSRISSLTGQSLSADELKYTFNKITVLDWLPHPARAREFLERLRDDKGVRAVMVKYKWTIGTLTELDPASSTTHSKRLLGLNVNRGEAIKLRIRSDDYEGFCSYREARDVLCHELSHMVHSEHDAEFWALCKKLEKEVVSLDPFGGRGRQIGEEMFAGRDGNSRYFNQEEMDHCDDGGWHGSTQVVGTLENSTKAASAVVSSPTSGSSESESQTQANATPASSSSNTDTDLRTRMADAAEHRRTPEGGK